MNSVIDIKRELDALDAEFNSTENCRTGKITQQKYLARHKELREKLAEAELAARTRPAPRPRPRTGDDALVTRGFLDAVLQEIAPSIGQAIRDRLEHALLAVFSRLTTAERRVHELEIAVPRYVGTHQAGKHYPKNSIITDHGSLWIARQGTDTRPPGDHWQLCVKGSR